MPWCRSRATLRGAVTFVLFRPVGWRGSFATTSVAGIGAGAVGAVPQGAVGAQGGTVAPAADPSATFQLVAGFTGLSVALNVHGFKDGGLTLTVPVGWTVVTHFRNHDGMLPHSAEVILNTHPLPTGPVAPAFARALSARLERGLISEETAEVRFIADGGGPT